MLQKIFNKLYPNNIVTVISFISFDYDTHARTHYDYRDNINSYYGYYLYNYILYIYSIIIKLCTFYIYKHIIISIYLIIYYYRDILHKKKL